MCTVVFPEIRFWNFRLVNALYTTPETGYLGVLFRKRIQKNHRVISRQKSRQKDPRLEDSQLGSQSLVPKVKILKNGNQLNFSSKNMLSQFLDLRHCNFKYNYRQSTKFQAYIKAVSRKNSPVRYVTSKNFGAKNIAFGKYW